MKYGLSDEQLKQIQDIISSYDEIEEAILFGSRAIDTYKEASDVDIAIKGKKVTAFLTAKLKYRFEEDTYLPFFFDFAAYPTITNEALKKHIDTKGVSIYRAGWKECKLGDVAIDFAMGPFGSNIKAENFIESGVPVIRGKNLNFYKYVNGDFVYLSEVKANELAKSNCFPDDLVFTHRGTIGQVGIIPKEKYPRYVISQSGMKLTVAKNVLDKDYLFYFFKSNIGQHELLQNESQVGVPAISSPLSSLKSVNLTLPPLPEQKAIASVLSSLDDKIDLLHRQNKTLEAMAETLFRLWFVEEAKSDDNATLGEFSQNIKINARVEDLQKYDYYVGLEHIPRKSIALTSWSKPDELESNKSVFTKGDILFGKLRSYFHKVVFAPIDGVCSTDILVIRPKKKEWFSFCLFWFCNKDVVEHSDLGSGGTRMPRTNWEILSSYQIPMPDLKQIEDFDMIIRPATNKITFNIQEIRTIEKLRDTLLPKLMSGEVRVEYDAN